MGASTSPHIGHLDEQLAGWDDGRVVAREQIRDWYMFIVYLVNLLDDLEVEYRGHSWREGNPLGTLVLRATMHNEPVVSFVSARSFGEAIRILVRKAAEDVIEWRPDKYG
jgi:hypothetical protein